MAAQRSTNRNFALAILIFSSAVSVLSTDLYAPSLASLPAYFGTTPVKPETTLRERLVRNDRFLCG